MWHKVSEVVTVSQYVHYYISYINLNEQVNYLSIKRLADNCAPVINVCSVC